ncbi:MAG: hypothetical protein ACI9FB_003363 [Candidatus Azotimanducaceae bacterium]|jgi:hypothetical protein
MTALSWRVFSEQAPEIAEFGLSRIDGKVCYLATIRENDLPRIHPVTALVGDGRCFIFAQPDSSKVRDFQGNSRFNLHCSMSDSSGSSGEFQFSGSAVLNEEKADRALAESICSYRPSGSFLLFELRVSEATSNCFRGGRPHRKKWRATKF